jgi:hypothetical protein
MTAREVDDTDIKGKATRMNSGGFAVLCYESKHVISI